MGNPVSFTHGKNMIVCFRKDSITNHHDQALLEKQASSDELSRIDESKNTRVHTFRYPSKDQSRIHSLKSFIPEDQQSGSELTIMGNPVSFSHGENMIVCFQKDSITNHDQALLEKQASSDELSRVDESKNMRVHIFHYPPKDQSRIHSLKSFIPKDQQRLDAGNSFSDGNPEMIAGWEFLSPQEIIGRKQDCSFPDSGNDSLSESSTNTRSFAFPVLQSEWCSSPVRMPKADGERFKRHRGWRVGVPCCRF